MSGQTNGDVWAQMIAAHNADKPASERTHNPFAASSSQRLPRSSQPRKLTPKQLQELAPGLTAADIQDAKPSIPSNLLFDMEAAGLKGFVKEHKFSPDRRWRLDLAHIDLKIGIECHGGVWTQGRHTRGKGFTSDREKMNDALKRGWQVLEFTTDQVKSGEALATIQTVHLNRIIEYASK